MIIFGTIQNSRNGAPIEGVEIKLYIGNTEIDSVYSNMDGSFSFTIPHQYLNEFIKYIAIKDGYQTKTGEVKLKDAEDEIRLEIEPSPKKEKIRIKKDLKDEAKKSEDAQVDIGVGNDGSFSLSFSSIPIPAKIAIGIIAVAAITSIGLPAIQPFIQPLSQPSLSVSPDPVSFNLGDMNTGQTISRNFVISNTGRGTLEWNVSTDQPWITVNPISGSGSDAINIDVNTTILQQGSYSGIITVNSNGGTKQGVISLNVLQSSLTPTTVIPLEPKLKVSQYDFKLSTSTEKSNNVLQILNAGGRTLEWRARADKPWIELSKSSGFNNGSIIIDTNPAGLNPGSYAGIITIESNGGNDKVAVELNVPISTPTVTIPIVTPTVSPVVSPVISPVVSPVISPVISPLVSPVISKRQVWLVLSKDGTQLDDKIIEQGGVYLYTEKSLAGETDVPLFVTYVDSVFAGTNGDMVQLRYTWAISKSVTEIANSDVFGNMEVTEAGDNQLILYNKGKIIYLSRDTTAQIMGDLNFKIADSDTLRYYPMVLRTAPYEIRGSVASGTGTQSWDATNFAGFWYDLKNDLKSETLSITSDIIGRDISADSLMYTTIRQNKTLKMVENGVVSQDILNAFNGDGSYNILGWQAQPYIAIRGKANKLSKLIIEQGSATSEKKTLTVGETWDIGDGWTLSAQSMDSKASPRQVWLVLSKDGKKLDDKIIEQGRVYLYTEKGLAGETDVPLFVTYVDSVFAGTNGDMVQLRYTWAISKFVTEIANSDVFGNMEVTEAGDNQLILYNKGKIIYLSRDTTAQIMGDLNFKVADSDTLRYYPMVLRTAPGTYEIRGSAASGTGTRSWDATNFAGFWYDLKNDLKSETLSITSDIIGRDIPADSLKYTTIRQNKTLKVVENGVASQDILNAFNGDGSYNILGWQAQPYIAIKGKAKKLSKLIVEQGNATSEKKTLTVGETWDIGDGWTLSVKSMDSKAQS